MIIKKNLPNILTISRIIIIPIVLLLFYMDDNNLASQAAAFLFAIAGITDFLDGYLARIWNLRTNLGTFLDPIADKLLVGSIILMLVHKGKADVLPAIAIICREILVSGLREFLAGLRVSVPVSNLAKVKTTVQMIAIFLLILGNRASGFEYVDLVGNISLWIAAILTLITGYAYLDSALSHITENK